MGRDCEAEFVKSPFEAIHVSYAYLVQWMRPAQEPKTNYSFSELIFIDQRDLAEDYPTMKLQNDHEKLPCS